MISMITAHAGAEGTLPNTPESLRVLAAIGADAVEMDVRRAPDGILVLSHNPVESSSGHLRLEDAFAVVEPAKGLSVNIDLKQEGLIEAVADIAGRTGMLGRILFTGSAGSADIAFAAGAGLPVWYNRFLLPPWRWADPFAAIRQKGLSVLNVFWRLPGEAMLKANAENLSLWTVDEAADQERLLRAGVRNITTRKPLQALRLRADIQM